MDAGLLIYFSRDLGLNIYIKVFDGQDIYFKNCQRPPPLPPESTVRSSPNKKRDQFQPFLISTDCHTKHIAHGLWPSMCKIYRRG